MSSAARALIAESSVLGIPLPALSYEDQIQAAGCHRTTARYRFALTAYKAAPAAKRAAILKRFGCTPIAVPLPAPGPIPFTDDMLGMASYDPEVMRRAEDIYSMSRQLSWATVANVFRDGLDTVKNPKYTPAHSSILSTRLLEQYKMPALERIEPAFFALTSWHKSWRVAGRIWLAPWAPTYLRDWLDARPAVAAFACEIQRLFPDDIPAEWLNGSAPPPIIHAG